MASLEVLKKSWRLIAIIAIPLTLCPLLFLDEDTYIEERKTTKSKTGFTMLLMGLFWTFEVIPIPITALLPLLLFPLLGIQDIYDVSENYAKESNMIFLTGIIVALSLEYSNLHHRIALRAMTLVGGSSVRLLLAVMIVASFLAMWLSSTTCVALLLPTVVSIIDEVNDSPEIMTKSEARRRSRRASSIGLGHARGSSMDCGSDAPRKLSTRRSTFANVGLAAQPLRGQESPLLHPLHFRPVNIYSFNEDMSHKTESGRSSITSNNSHTRLSPHLNHIPQFIEESKETNPSRTQTLFTKQPNPPVLHLNNKTVKISIEPPTPEDKPERHGSINHSVSFSLDFNNDIDQNKTESEIAEENKVKESIKTMFLMGIAYAANIGGTAVITGAGPNKIFKEVIKPMNFSQNGKYTDMTFLMWMALNFPQMIINLLIAWVYLLATFQGFRSLKRSVGSLDKEDENVYRWKSQAVNLYLRREYEKLGRMTYHEYAVGICFILVIVCWITRDPALFDGWGSIKTGAKSGDSTGAMVGVLLLFVVPKSWEFLSSSNKDAQYEPLLDWRFVATKLPWSVLLVLGSGFAISDAFAYSGLSEHLVKTLRPLDDVSNNLLLLCVIVFVTFITELVSNTACANIIIPIVISLSISLELHPLYLTVAATVACSYAFMLPVASPTNSMAYAAGNFGSFTMAKTGFFLNIICIGVLFANTVVLGPVLFNDWKYEYASNNSDYSVYVATGD